jgi:hypothetical protein
VEAEESEMEEENDGHLDKNEGDKWSAVIPTLGGYSIVDDRYIWPDKMNKGDGKGAPIEDEVLEILKGAGKQQTLTIWKALTISRDRAKENLWEIMTEMTPKGSKAARKNTPTVDTGN